MSLHRIPKSPYWYTAYKLANGRRTLRSTQETQLQRAKVKAMVMERLEEEIGREDTDRRFIERIITDAMRRLGHERLRDEISLEKYLQQWLSNSKESVAESTWAKYKLAVRLFLGTVNGGKRLMDINSQDVQKRIDSLVRSGRSPGTINLFRSIIRIPFKLAKDSGVIQINPCISVKPVRDYKTHKGVFSESQVSQILTVCDPEWRLLVLIGYYSGQRLGDCVRLRWQDITNGLHFRQGKTGNEVIVPIHPALASALAQARQQEPGVFPTLNHKPIPDLSKAFSVLIRKAGIETQVIRKGKRTVYNLSFHSLRHSFSSALANAQIPVEIRQKLVGHKSKEMQLHYSHLELVCCSIEF
jgi:integrase